jgi:hypothetical protein
MTNFSEFIQDTELANKITDLVKEIAPNQDAFVCRLEKEIDDDGVESWSIDLCYNFSTTPINPRDSMKLIYKIREYLSDRGDNRFPYIFHNFDAGQPIASAC